MNLKIAFLQLMPGSSTEENKEKGIKACRKAAKRGADIALFPEMFSCGYDFSAGAEKLAVKKDGAFVKAFKDLSKELSMAIAVTFLEEHEPKPLNSVVLFDRDGKEILHYSKVHTCDFDAEKALCGGDGFYVSELDFGRGKVKVGSMICFDREFPESARILGLLGAELILAPNACPMEINRLSALRTRAYENMVAVATCNYPTGHPDCNGRSSLFDGVPWVRSEPGIRDMCIFLAPGAEDVYIAELDLEQLRKHRTADVMGDKFRHPSKYKILTENGAKKERTAPPAANYKAENPFMQMAIDEAREGIYNGDGGPFGCVIVKDGCVLGRGHNSVLLNNDSTHHGEISAIRDAEENIKSYDLKGCELYTTGEPCTMCLAACIRANIERVYYGCTIEDNSKIGFRDGKIDSALGGRENIKGYLTETDREACLKLFEEYKKLDKKVY